MSFKPVWNALEGRFDYVLAPISVVEVTVPGSTTQVVDTKLMSSFDGASYYFRIRRVADGNIRAFNLSVIDDSGSVKDTLSSKLGPNISVSVDTAVSGLDYELSITNNNAGDIEVIYIKTSV